MKQISVAKRFLMALAALAAAPLARGGEALPAPVSGVVTLVSGKTYTLTENSDLSGITQISVVEGSTLEYDISSGQTLTVPCKVKVAITDGGQLIVPAGQTLRVAELRVDGTQQATGSYSGVSWIQGAGTVRCGPAGLAVILK